MQPFFTDDFKDKYEKEKQTGRLGSISNNQNGLDTSKTTTNLNGFSLLTPPDPANEPSYYRPYQFSARSISASKLDHAKLTRHERPNYYDEHYLSQIPDKMPNVAQRYPSPINSSVDSDAPSGNEVHPRIQKVSNAPYLQAHQLLQVEKSRADFVSRQKAKSLYGMGFENLLQNHTNPSSEFSQSERMKIACTLRPDANDDERQANNRRDHTNRVPIPGWPKRPLSAYDIFLRAEKEKLINNRTSRLFPSTIAMQESLLQEKIGLLASREHEKIIARAWESLPETLKSPYMELSGSYYMQYRRDLEAFIMSQGANNNRTSVSAGAVQNHAWLKPSNNLLSNAIPASRHDITSRIMHERAKHYNAHHKLELPDVFPKVAQRSPFSINPLHDFGTQIGNQLPRRIQQVNNAPSLQTHPVYQVANTSDPVSTQKRKSQSLVDLGNTLLQKSNKSLEFSEPFMSSQSSQSFQCKKIKAFSTLRPETDDDKSQANIRRGRPKRDPRLGWPKRPLSAYNIFFKEEREKLLESAAKLSLSASGKEDSPFQRKRGLVSFSEMGKTIGSKWKTLSDTQKVPYKELADSYLIQYRKQIEIYQDKNDFNIESGANFTLDQKTTKREDVGSKEKKRRGRPKRDPREGWPKRPLSAYNIFFKQERKRLLESDPAYQSLFKIKVVQEKNLQNKTHSQGPKSNKELVRTIASNWKILKQQDREYYEKKAEGNLIEYRKEMERFQKGRQQNEK